MNQLMNKLGWLIESIEQLLPGLSRSQYRILVMDDEEMFRDLSKRILAQLGYDVTTACNGNEALQLYRDENGFDLVIMDLMVQQGMGGQETITKLRELDPQVKAILSSGCSRDNPVVANCKRYGFSAAIAKPFDFREFVAVVRQVIEGARPVGAAAG